MTKIANKIAYIVKSPLALTDYAIGTNSEDLNPTMAKDQSISMQLSDVLALFLSGLSPETGGTLKVTEIEVATLDTDIATTINALSPSYDVLAYELVFFNVEGQLFLLKKFDLTIGTGGTTLLNSDFVEFPISVGPPGSNGTNGTNGTNGVGITSIVKTGTSGLVDTYTITFTNATTTTFTITNGAAGADGTDGTNGTNGTFVNVQDLTKTTSFVLQSSDNAKTFFVENGASDITVTVPSGLPSAFFCSVVRKGTGEITFVTSGTTINNPTGLKIDSRYDVAVIEQEGSTNVFDLFGNTKA